MEPDKINILIVDDRPENLVALEALLDSPHIRLVKCLSGEEALKRVLKEEFALILLDVQMPGMDGYETAKLIKSREKNKHTPIIFVTAINKEPEHVFSGYSTGAIDYLFKPFDPDVLKLKVEQFVQLYFNSKQIKDQAELLHEKTKELEAANEELVRITTELQKAEELARAVGETSQDTIILFDEARKIIRINPAVDTMFGYRADEVTQQSIEMLFPEGLIQNETGSRSDKRLEIEAQREDGTRFPAEVQINEYVMEGEVIYVCSVRDITDRIEQMKRLKHMATHDDLTGLPNRAMLYESMEKLLQPQQKCFSLLLLDLDQFKAINDTLGHHFGDILLTKLGKLLQDILLPPETVYRLGGDEFAILLPGSGETESISRALTFLTHIDQPVTLEHVTLSLGASLGLVVCPDHGNDIPTLVRRADVAMYTAKRNGTGYAVYNIELDQNDPYKLQLMGDLRAAVEKRELELLFQPEVQLATGELVCAEALLRWNHPRLGLIPPSDFIPIAEQIGVIYSLTMWVLRSAIRQCKRWEKEGIDVCVAVNLSVRNLQDIELPETIKLLLEEYGVAPQKIMLEITESFIMSDPARAMEVLLTIHEMGIRLAIDDFGTGYSSLAYLKVLPVNLIKIDKSFVSDMVNDHADSMIVSSIIYMAHNLGLEVVAEGVEDERSRSLLAGYECDIIQGFYVQRPMRADDFKRWYTDTVMTRRSVGR